MSKEDLRKAREKQRRDQKIGTAGLLLAMATMAAWGWTPLKDIIPAATTLTLFIGFLLTAIAGTLSGIYRGIKVRALQASIEDE